MVLADEPTANLDTANGEQAMEIMKRLNEQTGTAFVFATHDPRVMSYARRIVKMQDGQVIDDGLNSVSKYRMQLPAHKLECKAMLPFCKVRNLLGSSMLSIAMLLIFLASLRVAHSHRPRRQHRLQRRCHLWGSAAGGTTTASGKVAPVRHRN